LPDDSGCDTVRFFDKSGHEDTVAQQIDAPWEAATVLMDQVESPPRKGHGIRSASNAHPMHDVLDRVRPGKLMDVKAHRNTLFELPHVWAGKFVTELWLPHKDDLEQFPTLCLKVRQHP
jgi:hypothetical protein